MKERMKQARFWWMAHSNGRMSVAGLSIPTYGADWNELTQGEKEKIAEHVDRQPRTNGRGR